MANISACLTNGLLSRYLAAVAAIFVAFIPAALFASEAAHADALDLTTHTVGYLALGYGASIVVHMWTNAAHF